MQRWEYNHFSADILPWKEMKVGDRKVKICDFVDQLGATGWELVSVVVVPPALCVYWFKRPIE
jgi:hypothetical protein